MKSKSSSFLRRYLLRKDFFHRVKTHVRVNILRRLHKDGFDDQAFILAETPVKTIFDVGANIGSVAADYLERFPHADVFCFEPLPDAIIALERRFRHNPRLKIIKEAVSNTPGQTVSFFVKPLGGMSSLYRPFLGSSDEIKVPTITLDKLCADRGIQTVDVLKIDIEGAEIQALEGARHLLTKGAIRLIYSEVRMVAETENAALTHHLAAYLEQFDYSLHNIYDIVESGARGVIYANALFLSPPTRADLKARLGEGVFTRRF